MTDKKPTDRQAFISLLQRFAGSTYNKSDTVSAELLKLFDKYYNISEETILNLAAAIQEKRESEE